MDYRKTLNLPKTKFKMKANLAQREPQFLERWERQRLYAKLQAHTSGRPLFVLHDGPPYANGHIHLGTAFNKVLKDIILKSKRLAGYHCPYVPGWDCHGLPIEHNVDKELGAKKGEIPILAKRAACRKYAEKWIEIQKAEFKRLGVLGDWDAPYLTMTYDYEAAIAREFHRFLLAGSVVRHRKPVYWCACCQTALAEAEVEYREHRSPSIYVKFPVRDDLGDLVPGLGGRPVSVVIWTTTPWTLPANLAVAFHPDFVYVALEVGGEVWIMAKELAAECMQRFGVDAYRELAEIRAADLEGRRCRHPFLDRDSLMVLADYVTADTGTGCVHTAPGHGAEDYLTGLRYGLEPLSPVDDEGVMTEEAGPYAGWRVPEVNRRINDDLAAAGLLLLEEALEHSYPHCWRCKQPVIYRATPQWFISMEQNDLRKKALEAIGEVRWTPSWGEQRIRSMVESRPDWCLSRQRAWGVPVTVFRCAECGEVLRHEATCRKVEERFAGEGADAWFRYEAAELLADGAECRKCGSKSFCKESDILDVWFDSGVSHAAVLEPRQELRWPADLYLEGSDQHRGWFQSALLAAVGTRGRAPYLGVLTHGYVVDGQGKKMSKSVGNVVAPQEVIDKYGAEILRLWVASEDYRDDVKVSDEILAHVADAYRKIRNTLRYLLSNLYDFDVREAGRAGTPPGLTEIDRWALDRLRHLVEQVTRAYDRYEFHAVYHRLHNFCTTMSSLYLDVLKDRLYASAPDDPARRAAQWVIFRIADSLLRLMAPVLSVTAAEGWEHLYGLGPDSPVEESVFFAEFPAVDDLEADMHLESRWQRLIDIRAEITRVLERARREELIGHSLDAEVLVEADGELLAFVKDKASTLRELCIVSKLGLAVALSEEPGLLVEAAEEVEGLRVGVRRAPGSKCERCWMVAESVGEDAGHPTLCRRCVQVVEGLAGG